MSSGPQPRFVVGIGASAGGLAALERFFDNVPRETGMAFVVVQHLSPDFKSLMDELLARHTGMPIHPVSDGMQVEPDNVYLIPRKKEMIISDGRLLLSDRERVQEAPLPIDVFFRSLAQDCGPRAVAIVLSGGGTDGSRGIRDVHAAGGVVMVQDNASAQFDGMPKTARDAGVAEWILAPEEMPGALLMHAEKRAAEPPAPTAGEPAGEAVESKGLDAVYRMLQEEFGLDFTHYKPSTVTRRIERRLALARSTDIGEYVQRLRSERDELDVLYRDLLIGVTRFFRDPEAFRILEETVLPELLQRQPLGDQLRIWVAGCATGEEVYSLAIVLRDLMLKHGERSVQIFATDVHRGSIERASRAVYDTDAVINVSKERLARYFVRMGDAYQVVPDLRQMVVFAQHNVIKDAPFTRVDLVSCRNLLIYLQPAAQQKVLSLFRFALRRGGVLFLGPSETTGLVGRDFETIDKHWRLYRKHTDTRPAMHERAALQADASVGARTSLPLHAASAPPAAPGARYSLTHLLGTYDTLLEETMPPSLLVTDRGELIHAFGGASRFLRPRDGRQDLDVLDVVDRDLKMVLVGGLKRALNEPSAIVYRGVRIVGLPGPGESSTEPPREKTYKVTIRRVRSRTGGAPHLLISFDETEATRPPAPPRFETEIDLEQIPREQLRALETELSHTKENLQAAIEELETSNEELQASNEELQSSNEELQSTNEELQSVNEELYTVNAEYQRKISELTELANDMDNLLASTEVGAVFLDRQLKIRKFTPQIAETFNLLPHDVGRSIETFTYKMDHPELLEDLRHVAASGEPVERELRGVRGKAFFLRVLPYRAKGAIDGVVLTLIDVDGLKQAEDALFHERYLLNSLLATVPDAIYFKDAAGRFIRANMAMAKRLGLQEPAEIEGKSVAELGDQHQGNVPQAQDAVVLRTGQAQYYNLEQRARANGRPEWDLVSRLPLRDAQGAIVGIIVIFRNVTEQKNAEEDIREAVRRRDQFLAMLSHELRNPLGAIVTATALLKVDTVRAGAALGGGDGEAGANARRTDRLLATLERQSQQMTRLLDDLLEASRVTQNKVELRKEPLNVNAVVKEATDAMRGQMEAHGLLLTVELSPRPMTVDADPARLQQILVNLLSNALKYTPREGHVWLRVEREDDKAVLRLKDDGVGIRPDMLESVFDLFVQSRSTLDRAAGGLGVGLTLVRSLAAMHGGSVSAHSEGEGKGSEFVVRLPLAAIQRDGEAVFGNFLGDGAPPAPDGDHHDHDHHCAVPPGATIVVVEDNADSREMLCELLQLSGYKCRTAASGNAALKLIEEVRPDIAILDVGLPEMDGYELARRVRQSRKKGDLCLIALTGYGQPSDRAQSAEAGFDAHLVKPIQVDHLLSLLERLRAPAPVESAPRTAPPA